MTALLFGELEVPASCPCCGTDTPPEVALGPRATDGAEVVVLSCQRCGFETRPVLRDVVLVGAAALPEPSTDTVRTALWSEWYAATSFECGSEVKAQWTE